MYQGEHPALSADRVAFRQRLGLRIVREEEEGRNIRNQVGGVYGFTGAPSSDELPIFIKPVYRCFEVHKLASGDYSIVGYVNSKEQAILDAGAEPVTIKLYPDPQGDSDRLVSVPQSRIDRRRPPSRDDGNPMVVEVGPAA